jgi:hypothetical protein
MRQDEMYAGGHQEGHREIDSRCPIDKRTQMGMQRICATRYERAIMRCVWQEAGQADWRRDPQMDMAADLDDSYLGKCFISFEQCLCWANPGDERRLLRN